MNFDKVFAAVGADGTPVYPVIELEFDSKLELLTQSQQQWVRINQFKAKSGTYCLLPNAAGEVEAVLVGMGNEHDFWSFGVATKLPAGDYQLDWSLMSQPRDVALLYIAWGLGSYRFTRYKDNNRPQPRLALTDGIDSDHLSVICSSVAWARDLINTPAHDLRPISYEMEIKDKLKSLANSIKVIDGEKLLEEFPLVEAVGRAGEQAPRLVDIYWGNKNHAKLTLVGKGVCFDSGGLGIKTGSGMRQMKKDMGGSALVLSLAYAIMRLKLPVQLRVIVPLVENAIAGNSMRPGDVIRSRSGKTVEIGHTDAEGRLILADALALACEDNPDYLIDFATLTGAARVAMGPDIPAYFASDDNFANNLERGAESPLEVICRLPLHKPYRKFLESKIADIENISSTSYGGAITAALFLQEFVSADIPWVHFDVNADNTRELPGRPQGGEAHGFFTVINWVLNTFR